MPWPGDPRINLQEGRGGMAKAYQVRQVLLAIERSISAAHATARQDRTREPE